MQEAAHEPSANGNNGVHTDANGFDSKAYVDEITFNEMQANEADQMTLNHMWNRFERMFHRGQGGCGMDRLWSECGYAEMGQGVNGFDAQFYRELYDKDALAARIVQVQAKESWKVQPMIFEDEDAETETQFETDWKSVHKNIRVQSWYEGEEGSPVWDYLLRLDILSGIGHYGVLLLGIDDGRPLDQPLEGFEEFDSSPAYPGTEGLYGPQPLRGDAVGYDEYTTKILKEQGVPSYATPVPYNVKTPKGVNDKVGTEQSVSKGSKGKHKLIFMKVFDETLAQITRYERDPHNARFGLPQMYLLTFNDPRNDPSGGAGLPVASAHCHWSRLIHVADNRGSNDVLGYPRLKQVYTRLWDAFKVYGAAGEGFWQMAFSILSLETNPNLGGDVRMDKPGIRGQLSNLKNRLQRQLVLAGMTAKTIAPTVNDPTPFIGVFIEVICIFLGMPVRVFKGSERGELASSQDDSQWNDQLRHRQMFHITPNIIVPLVDRLIAAKVLTEPESYGIEYGDLESLSDKDKAAIGLQMTQTMMQYIQGGCENLMAPIDFMTEVMHIPRVKAEAILELAQQGADNEEQMTIDTPDEMAEKTAAMQPPAPEGDTEDTGTESETK